MIFWVSVFSWCLFLVDNQQAITAVKRRYSKRLRCLNRTHRIAIGSLHENISDERQQVEIRYIESKIQKGNIYTKALVLAQFCAERLLIGMQRPSDHSNNLIVLRTPREEWKIAKFLRLIRRLSLNSLMS